MKFLKTTFLILVLGGLNLQAQIRSTPATIYLEKGGNPRGYITASAPRAIKFSTTETGSPRIVQLSEIRGTGVEKAIRLEERGELLASGRAAFGAGKYQEAATAFAKVVKDYQKLVLYVPQNFVSEAMFYQIESHRRLGDYKALPDLFASPPGKSLDSMLMADRYQNIIKLQKLWAIYGAGDMATLESKLESYQIPVTGKAKLLPTPNFKKMPQNELAQIAFLRGKIYESKGEKNKALQDFGRVFSLSFAGESALSQQAMEASMAIQAENPTLKSENEKVKRGALRGIQTVAHFYKRRFPGTAVPTQFQEYAVMPELDVVPQAEEPEEEMKDTPKKSMAVKASPEFKQLDKNKDGKINEKEYLDSDIAKKEGSRWKARKTFKSKDKNKDGFWSPEEHTAKKK